MEKLAKIEHKVSTSEECDRFVIKVSTQEEDMDLEVAVSGAKEKMKKFISSVSSMNFEAEAQWSEPVIKRLTEQSTQLKRGEREFADLFIGFRATQEVSFDLPWDAAVLCKIVIVCEQHGLLNDAQIASYVSELESRKKALLQRAVQEAQERAKTICEAAGVKLGSLAGINTKPEETVRDKENLHFGSVRTTMADVDSLISMADTSVLERTISIMAREILKKRPSITLKEEVYLTFVIE